MKNIISHKDLLSKIPAKGRSYLLVYKSDSEKSICAYSNIDGTMRDDLSIFSVDVSLVRDIHGVYGIDTVPALIVFDNGAFSNVIKGCHESSFYEAIFNNELFVTANPAEEKSARRVTVYSTPTCSWCNTLKTWLQKYNIRYNDIDVSRDEKAAEDLVRRSGQQGVPQTDIDGHIVVGFDQLRLRTLLGIN